MDSRETPTAQHLTYWVRGGELLNVRLAYHEPDAEAEREEGDWFPADRDEMVGNMSKAFEGDPRHDDVVALTSLIGNPTKWGLYDRDVLENWTEGRVGLVGDAAHPMLPTFGQGAAQAFEDAAVLGKCFALARCQNRLSVMGLTSAGCGPSRRRGARFGPWASRSSPGGSAS